jgi:serine/threonine-protein kinase
VTDLQDRLRLALADRYAVERELGAGGMATVYLAEDLKHKRKVALKVLKPELAAVLGAERFVQEITTTAALQHPHILPLFDSGTADGFLYYVMPFIDGETLRTKLDRETQLGIGESVQIATQVADALDYAHRHGVIHRDIKPENVLLHDGRPMVADFGIALAVSAAAGGRMTETGLSLGTPHYMSPEQATAEKEITARSDVYSLGSVLYEMLTGSPPHVGASAQQIIMKIVTEEAQPVTKLRKAVPPNVAAAVAKALEKLPADRFPSAKAFAEALGNSAFTAAAAHAGTNPQPHAAGWQRDRRLLGLAAGVLLAVGVAGGWGWKNRVGPAVTRNVARFEIAMGQPGASSVQLAISSDGRRVAMSDGIGPDGRGILIRDLAAAEVVRISGTAGARHAAFSPDGQWLSFNLDQRLVKAPSQGGPALTLSDDALDGGTWMSDGSIVYTRASEFGLSTVSSDGGPSRVLTTLDVARGEWGHWRPEALPGGNVVIFTNYAAASKRSRIEALDLRSGKRTLLVEDAVNAHHAPSGHLLFVRGGTVFAVRFDARRLTTSGSEVPVLEDVFSNRAMGQAAYAVAPNGTLAYIKASSWATKTQVVWLDRTGQERPAMPDPGRYFQPRLSPDGKRIALTIREDYPSLGLFELGRGILTTVEGNRGAVFNPVWTPDGRNVVCTWEVRAYDLFSVPVDGSGPPRLMLGSEFDKAPSSIASETGLMAYDEERGRTHRIMLAPIDGSVSPRQLDSMSTAAQPVLSPDGRWVAFTADARGGPEVFVRPTDGSGGRAQISVGGGTEPRWTRRGREIVFRQGNAVMSASADPAAGVFSPPVLLFRGPYLRAAIEEVHEYDVTPDGDRLLMVKPVDRPDALPVVIVLNWLEELQAKVSQ